MRALLTGATGFVGQHLLWSLLQRSAEGDVVYCLVRGDSLTQAEMRLARVLDAPGAPELSETQRRRCVAVWGDVTEPDLTYDSGTRQSLPPNLTRIIHCAATVRFNQRLASARRINVDGTRHILRYAEELQRRGTLERVDYIGTAFVAGTTRGLLPEESLQRPPGFHNTYEQTKWEAEALVRERQSGLPVTIFRPSIVVGDSQSGYTANYRVLYAPLRLLAQGVALFAPADPRGLLDVVPIDYVVRSFHALSDDAASRGGCYHLAAGPGGQSSISELLEMAAGFFRVRKPLLIPPAFWMPILKPLFYLAYAALWGDRRAQLDRVSHYFPYFAYRASFATAQAEKHLRPQGIQPPSVQEYFRTLMQFCVDTDWGAKRAPRTARNESPHGSTRP
jgi:long-chain acyl-CoA synthetase